MVEGQHESVTDSTRRADVKVPMESAGSDTYAGNAAREGMVNHHVKVEEARRRNSVPKYMRYNDWGLPEPLRTVEWTERAPPLPSPPPIYLNSNATYPLILTNPKPTLLRTQRTHDRFAERLPRLGGDCRSYTYLVREKRVTGPRDILQRSGIH